MKIGEYILFRLAKKLYRYDISLTKQQKESIKNICKYEKDRSLGVLKFVDTALRYGVDITEKIVVDFGCATGAVSHEYYRLGAKKVIGLDIDKAAITRARNINKNSEIDFILNNTASIPLEDNSVDVVMSDSVFEHITHPKEVIDELYRILKPGGKIFIGTWGWYHPFAPHLFTVMPVPWCHVFFSEKTILRTCRKVFYSEWYQPVMYDIDENGQKVKNKFPNDYIPYSYVNKLLIKDFENIFKNSLFDYKVYPSAFSHKFAKWTKPFIFVPLIKEFVTSYIHFILEKR